MKHALIALALSILLSPDSAGSAPRVSSAAGGSPSNVVFTTRLSDGSPNTWTLADLQAALELINRKYHRDCRSASGRAAWHGRKLRSVTNATNLTITTTFEDGTTFVDAAPKTTPAQSVKAANARRKVTVATNGVPSILAAARLRRAAEINNGPTNVTITITAGGN